MRSRKSFFIGAAVCALLVVVPAYATKTTNNNYGSISSPGNTFNRRISADNDTFSRNDIDSLGMALDDHDHTSGKGLPIPYAAIKADAWGSWSSPTVKQSTTTITTTVNNAVVNQMGKTVQAQANLLLTSAGVAGSAITLSPPVTPAFTNGYSIVGNFIYARSGVALYEGVVVMPTTTTMQFISSVNTGGILGSANGPSFAVANNDVLSVDLHYQAQ